MPMTPLTGDLGKAGLAVLERYADPRVLLAAGAGELTRLITTVSGHQQGPARARQWLAAAAAAIELYGDHPAVPFDELAAEVVTEIRLLRAIQAELAVHAAAREQHYLQVHPGQQARSLPGFAEIGAPVLVAAMGRPGRFRDGTRFKSYAGLAPRASETGETDRKGQPMSKAGPSQLRSAFVRAADTARRQDPQLARIYYLQMTERGATHLKACCVVAGHLAERAWTTLNRGTPYVICDNNGNPVTAGQARQIIAEKWTVPEDVRKRRRSRKQAGKAPQAAATGPDRRGDPPRPRSSRPTSQAVKTALGVPVERTSHPRLPGHREEAVPPHPPEPGHNNCGELAAFGFHEGWPRIRSRRRTGFAVGGGVGASSSLLHSARSNRQWRLPYQKLATKDR